MQNKSVLILVDLQNDFCLGGSLAVPGGDEVIGLANQLQPHFSNVVATKDWHPREHVSFAANHPGKKMGEQILVHGFQQMLWPIHCVQETKGAEFHPALNTQLIHEIFYKGTNPLIDSYSTFFDNEHQRSTGLADYLRARHIIDVYLMGLATDYCVKYSALDAKALGFNVFVIQDGCRGVELQAGDVEKALREMQEQGIQLI